jgi:hypothetical protein
MESPEAIGAVVRPVAEPSRRVARFWNLTLAVGCAAVLGLATWLTPDPTGVGTHEKLGLPPCTMYVVTGLPCPFCGMTTSFSHMAHGQVLEGFATQPMGGVLFLMTVAGVFFFGVRTWNGAGMPDRLLDRIPKRVALWIGGAFLLAWIYKIWAVWAGFQVL